LPVLDVLDALVDDLGDVQQTVLARQDVDDGAEVQQLQHGAFVDLAHFGFRGDASMRRLASAMPSVDVDAIVPSS
jgi:hypothetical protein